MKRCRTCKYIDTHIGQRTQCSVPTKRQNRSITKAFRIYTITSAPACPDYVNSKTGELLRISDVLELRSSWADEIGNLRIEAETNALAYTLLASTLPKKEGRNNENNR